MREREGGREEGRERRKLAKGKKKVTDWRSGKILRANIRRTGSGLNSVPRNALPSYFFVNHFFLGNGVTTSLPPLHTGS